MGVTKRFGALGALNDFSADFPHGELCGLAGHNGAGKSTLINVLCGAFAPDEGRIELHGRPYRPRNYRDANRAGVFRVSQELTLFENLTVAENASFGLESLYTRCGFLDERRISRDLARFLDSLGLDVLPMGKPAGELPLALKQLTEITRCLFSAHKHGIDEPVLLFDEPTSGLTQAQAEFVGARLRQLARRAIIVLTSHRGTELLDLSERVIVMRDGRIVADRSSRSLDAHALETVMVGTERLASAPVTRDPVDDVGVPTLRIDGIGGLDTIVVRRGEVVGLSGEGEGKSRVLADVAGWRPEQRLAVEVNGRAIPCSALSRARAGIRYVPGERAREGFSVWQKVRWNVTLPSLARGGRYRSFARRPSRETRFVVDLIARFGIRVPDVDGPVSALSGGNQQRLLVARTLDPDAVVLLCDRPTRGVDVMATARVHEAIRNAASSGLACLVTSDEPEELLSLCDRVIKLRESELGSGLAITGIDADGSVAAGAGSRPSARSLEASER